MGKKGRSAKKAPAVVVEEGSAPDEQQKAFLKKWTEIQKNAGYCGLCCGVLRHFKSHCSRRPACKQHAGNRPLNENEMASMKQEVELEHANPQAAKELKVAAAKKRHAEAWRPPGPESTISEQEYRMNFGKHSGGKGLTILQVLEKDPGYFTALVSWKNDIFASRPDLKAALQKAGVLEQLVAARPALQVVRAQKMLETIRDEKGQELHPEIKKLRAIQQIEASQILDSTSKEEALALVPAPAREPSKRKYQAQPKVLLPHCCACGSTEHKRPTCPHKDLQGGGLPEPDRSAVVIAHIRDKRKAALVSRLKYTQIRLRTVEYESRAPQMSRAPLKRCFLSMGRASPKSLVGMLVEDNLLSDLQGVPWPRAQCQASSQEGYISSGKTLGRLCFNAGKGPDISTLSVYHKCDVCGVRQSVALHNSVFDGFFRGGGSYGVTYAVLAFWNCVEGVSMSITVRQLNIGEELCTKLYWRASVIMALEAHRLQKQLVWGTRSSKTVEVELDATVICKWKEIEKDEVVYRYYCYIGARQRGSMQHLALMPLGISKSVGEPRVNPESSEAYHAFCAQAFGENKYNLLSMTDGAPAYRCRCEQCQLWFEEHHWVNHSRKPQAEYSRPIDAVVANVATGAQRPAVAGTMTLDKEWGLLKALLPNNLSAKTQQGIERCDVLVRAQQFRRMTSTNDRWQAFLKAAANYRHDRERAIAACKGGAGDFARRFAQRKKAALLDGEQIADGDAEVELLPGEAVALREGLESGDVQGLEAVDVQLLLQNQSPPPGREQPSVEASVEQLSLEDFAKLERACKQRRLEMARASPLSDAEEVLRVSSETQWGHKFFERQARDRGACGQHALNNLYGGPQFDAGAMDDALAELLASDSLPYDEPRENHVRGQGWYSHGVLAYAFQRTVPPAWRLAVDRVSSHRTEAEQWKAILRDDVLGVLVNLNDVHWVAVCKVGLDVFHVDSCYSPVLISQADWVSISSRFPDSYLVVGHDSEL
jgi:hypothetical protein